MSLIKTIKFVTSHPLNREHKLESMLRFAKWQIGSRLVPGEIVYDWINGSKFFVKTGEHGLTGNIYTGLLEFQDMAFLLHVLRSEDLFVDVGANVGSYSILACSVVGARGVAFEPVRSAWLRLVDNMRLNRLDEKLRCINKGVGATQGHLAFSTDSDATNHVLATSEQVSSMTTVEVTSLDAALHAESPALIKIDVEGYETAVMEGAQAILAKQSLHSVIMELNGSGERYGFDEVRVLELMFKHGFEAYSYNPLNRSLTNLAGKDLTKDNTLFIRDKSLVMERLRSSAKVSVNGKQF